MAFPPSSSDPDIVAAALSPANRDASVWESTELFWPIRQGSQWASASGTAAEGEAKVPQVMEPQVRLAAAILFVIQN